MAQAAVSISSESSELPDMATRRSRMLRISNPIDIHDIRAVGLQKGQAEVLENVHISKVLIKL